MRNKMIIFVLMSLASVAVKAGGLNDSSVVNCFEYRIISPQLIGTTLIPSDTSYCFIYYNADNVVYKLPYTSILETGPQKQFCYLITKKESDTGYLYHNSLGAIEYAVPQKCSKYETLNGYVDFHVFFQRLLDNPRFRIEKSIQKVFDTVTERYELYDLEDSSHFGHMVMKYASLSDQYHHIMTEGEENSFNGKSTKFHMRLVYHEFYVDPFFDKVSQKMSDKVFCSYRMSIASKRDLEDMEHTLSKLKGLK